MHEGFPPFLRSSVPLSDFRAWSAAMGIHLGVFALGGFAGRYSAGSVAQSNAELCCVGEVANLVLFVLHAAFKSSFGSPYSGCTMASGYAQWIHLSS